ncbi:DUF2953 domain-containing protein [Tepidibacillus sp. LV47]|uniref:DUF2953 domain-containing protein n=1 Tax=Tepidibacillus sp. LV47 TaxID=3398228 RepID=UPI003AAD0DE2
MNRLLWIILILLIFFFFILISDIKILIRVKKEDKNDRIEVDGWMLYHMIHIRKTVPLIIFESSDEGVKYKSHSNLPHQQKKKDRITKKKIKKWQWNVSKLLSQVQDFYGAFKSFLKKVHIDRLKWETKIGLDEAFLTAISAGMIWSIKGIFLGFLSKYLILDDKPSIHVRPMFNQSFFHTYIEAAFHFRMGVVVWFGIKVIIRLFKTWLKKT